MPSLVNFQPLLCTRNVNWSRYFLFCICSNHLVFSIGLVVEAAQLRNQHRVRRPTVPGCFRHIVCVSVQKVFTMKDTLYVINESDQNVLTPVIWVFLSLSTPSHANGKLGEHFWSFTAKQLCSVPQEQIEKKKETKNKTNIKCFL